MTSLRTYLAAVCLGIASFMSNTVAAQTQFEVTIKQFDVESVRGYVQPIGDMFGANMNAGLYHSAKIPANGFHIRVDLVGAATIIGDEQRAYNAKLPAGFVPETGSYKTATVFGGKGTTFRDVNSGLEYKGSDGIFNTRVFPLLMPQLSIGSFFGTEISLRYMSTPTLGSGKFPSTTLFGLGLRHSVSQHLNLPFDVGVGAYYSSFSAGSLIESEGGAVNVQLSKEFSFVTLYGGVALESSTTKIQYETSISNVETQVSTSLMGANRFRVTSGVELDVQAFRLFADANFGRVKHFSGGIAFGF
ncbi:MAG: hypothetical protein HY961_11950 [Ignavibacteriae bacterium]|nr:hypothetical protein [Ignavibacteriota bacterium]